MLALNAKNARQIRWHPAIIKWALHLKFISSGAYNALRGVIALPSNRIWCDYTHWMRAGTGFSLDVDAQVVREANIKEERERFVVLIWDEMRVKEDLFFDKRSCELVRFTDIGDVNNCLNKVEQQCLNKNVSHSNHSVATHMLLFMIRGLLSNFEYPYVHFATRGITADALYPIVWEAVQHLRVLWFQCNGIL